MAVACRMVLTLRLKVTRVTTDRLLLRQWRDDDLDAWAAINADPSVREFLGGVQTREQAAGTLARFRADLESRGWGWWALEEKATGTLIGMAGLDPVDADVPFTGVEIGWRLSPASWGKGYATEAARAVLAYAFDTLHLPEVLAIADAGNVRSHAVMRRLGMTHVTDFTDPTQPPGSQASVLYRILPTAR